jgi:TolA-binding protein
LKTWAASAVGVTLWAGITAFASAQGIYTCVDKHGRRLTADRPIAECLDREQRELSPSGITRRQIGPSMSDAERAALEAQQRKEAEERTRVIEERRRERVLVARYPDKATHDVERTAALQMVDDVTATAEKRIAELKDQRKTFDLEMEFYKKDPNKAPMPLRRKIAENEESIADLQRFILGQEQEKRKVHQKFDVELAKLKVLWESLKPVTAPVAAGSQPAAAPAPR